MYFELFADFSGLLLNAFIASLTIVVRAALASVGASIPIIIIMYIHYYQRHQFYKQIISPTELVFNKLKQDLKENKQAEQKLYKTYGVKDYVEFVSKGQRKDVAELGELIYNRVFQLKNDVSKYESDLIYFKGYSFQVYLSGLLNKRFPDLHFEMKWKKK